MRIDLSGSSVNLPFKVEAAALEEAEEFALAKGLPLRVGYPDSPLLSPGIYNPRLVKQVRGYRWARPNGIIPILPTRNLREVALAKPYAWSDKVINKFVRSIINLDEWQERMTFRDRLQLTNQYTYDGNLTADRLPEVLNQEELAGFFKPHELDFLQDCSRQLFDRAVTVVLPNPLES